MLINNLIQYTIQAWQLLCNICFQTPLHVCAECGYYNNIKVLLQHNADFLIKDGNGFTALEIAEKCGQVKCAELIKDAAGKCFALFFIYTGFVYYYLINWSYP